MSKGAEHFTVGFDDDHSNFFEQRVTKAFLDKLEAGIEIPTFPQLRDMNKMFLSSFDGLEKTGFGYVETNRLSVKPAHIRIAEVAVIEKNRRRIYSQTGRPFNLRICVTGPYTLASALSNRNDQSYEKLSAVLSEILNGSIFTSEQGRVALVSIDEPVFGMIDDPSIDQGTQGRESLLKAWEMISRKARERNVDSCIHLHSTSDDLFWAVESLGVIEAHVGDFLYQSKTTRTRLESEDKMLKASVAVSDFDRLVMQKLGPGASEGALANVWSSILRGTLDPNQFLESPVTMNKRLSRIIQLVGVERVALAGPECGLTGFPNYDTAIDCLRRVSKATRSAR